MNNKEEQIEMPSVKLHELTREKMFNLFMANTNPAVSVTDIDKSNTSGKKHKEKVRYETDKLILVNLLMDDDLENQIENRKNLKYDYMIGLLLYIASNPHFGYGYGYFKENILHFDNFLSGWAKFLDLIIYDINSLPPLLLEQTVVFEFSGAVKIAVEVDKITGVSIEYDNIGTLFRKVGKKYDFNIIIGDEASQYILESGESNGTGVGGGLYASVLKINNLAQVYTQLIELQKTT